MLATSSLDEILARLNGLPPAERAAVERLADEATAGMRWVPNPGPQTAAYECGADQLLYGGEAGGGKALALDTPLPSPTGWTTMANVGVGDWLLDEQGAPCRVTATSHVMIGRPCYRVSFSDGSEIVADGEHKWWTESDSDRDRSRRTSAEWRAKRRASRPKRGTGKRPDLAIRNSLACRPPQTRPSGAVRTTAQIAETVVVGGRANHAVPVAKRLHLPAADLAIDPYVLGAWLGDGSSYKGEITTADAEVLSEFHRAGYATRPRTSITHGVYALVTELKAADLIANKHIPSVYLRSSIEQRVALLQGLMDTDGYADPRGQCEYTTTRERLALDSAELLLTLGIKAVVTVGRAMLSGKDCGPKYRIKFVAPFPAFRLPRKLARQKQAGLRPTTQRRYITSVEPVESVPVKCVAVDSPSHLYLASRSMIPTHNTDLLLGLASQRHQRSLLLRRVNRDVSWLVDRMAQILDTRKGYNGQDDRWTLPDGRVIDFSGCQHPGDEERNKGRPKDFIGFDEAGDFLEQQVEFILGWLRTTVPEQRCRAVFATNPPTSADGEWIVRWFAPWVDPTHPLYPYPMGKLLWTCRGAEDEWLWFEGPGPREVGGELRSTISRTFIRSGLGDNPDLARTTYRTQLEQLPEELRRRYLLGDFTAAASDDEWQVLPTEWIRAAQDRWREDDGERMEAVGVDVAQGGADYTVLAPRWTGKSVRHWVGRLHKYKGSETPDGASVVARFATIQRHAAQANVDMGGGWGGATLERLREAEVSVYGFVPSGESQGRTSDGLMGFRNRRAESTWRLKELLSPESRELVALPPDPQLRADLAAYRYKVLAGGIIQIESKDDLRRRLGRSPDDGDAVIIAMATGAKRMQDRRNQPGQRGLQQHASGSRFAMMRGRH